MTLDDLDNELQENGSMASLAFLLECESSPSLCFFPAVPPPHSNTWEREGTRQELQGHSTNEISRPRQDLTRQKRVSNSSAFDLC